ncbi:hypothetical protein [Serratia fonticola]|nr:hypothetical protein [Serratia fonticola]NCG53229.1 hypothetical protein [Serratia fonticola]
MTPILKPLQFPAFGRGGGGFAVGGELFVAERVALMCFDHNGFVSLSY